jgi:hypothetical protein
MMMRRTISSMSNSLFFFFIFCRKVSPFEHSTFPLSVAREGNEEKYTPLRVQEVEGTFRKTPRTLVASSTCVYNETELNNVITNAPNGINATEITLCTSYMTLTKQIDIYNKSFNIGCDVTMIGNDTTCILDAQKKTIHFKIVESSRVSFQDISFINGYTTKNSGLMSGGSIRVENSATVKTTDCNFVSNVAAYSGGAIMISEATLEMTRSNLINNTSIDAFGAAIYCDESNLTLIGSLDPENPTTIENNQGELRGGAIDIYGSTVTAQTGYFLIQSNVVTVCLLFD